MDVAAILRSKGTRIVAVGPEASLREAAQTMARENVGALVVSDGVRGLQGILSERDIARAFAEQGDRLDSVRVADLMTREVETCAPEDSIGYLSAVMTSRRIRHLPVMQGDRLVGLVSIGDVVKFRIDEIEREAQAMRDYIAQV